MTWCFPKLAYIHLKVCFKIHEKKTNMETLWAKMQETERVAKFMCAPLYLCVHSNFGLV